MMQIVEPLPGWNVRGWSYLERQDDGQIHPGLDLNVGWGDTDLGVPVVCLADGVVVARQEWDGYTPGFGNLGMVEHDLHDLRLWSVYAHLAEFDAAFVEGAAYQAGQRIGACGKSGRQRWSHLHLEVRYAGPDVLPPDYWGGGLPLDRLAESYADPGTLLRILSYVQPAAGEGEVLPGPADALRRDREYNYQLKMVFESQLRALEARRRIKRGTVDRLIQSVPP